MPWTADLVSVAVDPKNAAAVSGVISYRNNDTNPGVVETQEFTTAEPAHIPLIAAGWIAQRQKIADFAANAQLGPMDLSAVADDVAAAAALRTLAKNLLVAQALKGAIDAGVRTADDPAYIAAVQSVADAVTAADSKDAFSPVKS